MKIAFLFFAGFFEREGGLFCVFGIRRANSRLVPALHSPRPHAPPGADEPRREGGPGYRLCRKAVRHCAGQLWGVPELPETGRSVKQAGGKPGFAQSTSGEHFYQSFAVSPHRTQQNKYLVAFVAARDTPRNRKIVEMFRKSRVFRVKAVLVLWTI